MAEDGLDLPEVAGRVCLRSVNDFERARKIHIAEEQRKLLPDNSLIDVLCDAVRLGREYGDTVTGRNQG